MKTNWDTTFNDTTFCSIIDDKYEIVLSKINNKIMCSSPWYPAEEIITLDDQERYPLITQDNNRSYFIVFNSERMCLVDNAHNYYTDWEYWEYIKIDFTLQDKINEIQQYVAICKSQEDILDFSGITKAEFNSYNI